MDSECVTLLPGVCEVLSSTGSSLPDDTSLEKLLDWFTELTKSGVNLQDSCPCLLELITKVIDSSSPEPSILSFSMKLTGLIAGNESSFQTLQKSLVLAQVFDTQRWHLEGLWEDPSVRIGWICGLRSMLVHLKAFTFFVQTDFIEPLLQLQTDTSIFVASAANQTLSHLLISCQFASSTERKDVGHKEDVRTVSDKAHPPIVAYNDNFSLTVKISKYFKQSLVPKEPSQLHQSRQVLKLLALLLRQSSPPQKEKLLLAVTESLEEVVEANYSQLTLPLMDVILAAHSCCGHDKDAPNQRISHLLSVMLNTRKPADLIHAAAAFLHSSDRDHAHTSQSVRLLLLPLDIVTGLRLVGTDISDEQRFPMLDQLRSKTSCISTITVSLANIPQIAQMTPALLSCPPGSIVSAVLIILRLCSGHSDSSSAGCMKTARNITGSGKVLKCALEALSALSNTSEAQTMLVEVFSLLLNYLDNPDCDPTVLQKSYQTLIKWLSVCKNLSSITDQHKQDLIQVVRKRACDIRWEVRDSTVEFLGHLAGVRARQTSDDEAREALLGGCCSTTPLLKDALQDPESYVRASAISAMSRTLAPSWHQGAEPTHEQVEIATRLLEILSRDNEGFARRAVVQYFTTWFSSCSSPSSVLTESVRSVLSLGSSDLDWEVKVHTQNLAELLLDKAFSSCHDYINVSEQGSTQTHPYALMSDQRYTLCTHTKTQTEYTEYDLFSVLDSLEQQGVISALFSGLFDCDRPVALKACRLLIKLRDAIRPLSLNDQSANVLEVTDSVSRELSACILAQKIKNILGENGKSETNTTERKSLHGAEIESGGEAATEDVKAGRHRSLCVEVYNVLMSLDLDQKLSILSQSSDYISNSPLSLLQDILSPHTDPKPGQEVIVDCY